MLELFQRLLSTYGYGVISLIIMAEGAGIPLPGETILLLGAAYAGAGHLSVRGVILAAALGAIAGDNLGYFLGRRGGRALLARYGHIFHLDQRHFDRAESFYARHGATTVFLARFVAVLRTLSSLLAGANRMPYRRFVAWNAAGGILWATVIGILGSTFGSQWHRVAHWMGRVGLFVALGVILYLLGAALRRRIVASGGLRPFLRGRLSPTGYLGMHLTSGVLLFFLSLALFGELAREVLLHPHHLWLDQVLFGLFPPRGEDASGFWRAVSFLGRPAVLFVAGFGIVLFLLGWRRAMDALLVALTVTGSEGINPFLKFLFARPRPGLTGLLTYSFPSAHATVSMAFFGLFVCLALRAGAPLWRRLLAIAGGALAILLIGLSRVYLGEHYPTDVLAGWAVGLAWLALVVTSVETWRRRQLALASQNGTAD